MQLALPAHWMTLPGIGEIRFFVREHELRRQAGSVELDLDHWPTPLDWTTGRLLDDRISAAREPRQSSDEVNASARRPASSSHAPLSEVRDTLQRAHAHNLRGGHRT